MRLMIIEDKEEDVKGILDYAKSKTWDAVRLGFQDGIRELDSYNPDVVILDMKDEAAQDMSGISVFSLIWQSKFRPTIVFSGYADTFTIDDPQMASLAQEPLFKCIVKGDEKPVLEHLDYLADVVPALSRLRSKLNIALIKSADAITTIREASANASAEVLDYLFSTRISHYFEKTILDQKLPAWVQYVLPPIGNQLFTGDIIHHTADNDKYAIILTPSCDLSRIDNGKHVLVAQNADFSSIDESFGLIREKGKAKYNERRSRMGSIMNSGYKNSMIYFPHVGKVLPDLCFDLKQISLIQISAISLDIGAQKDGIEWVRLASLCSPYRERASWAYLHTACRPGVPTIDTDSWVDEIYE